MRKVTKEQIEKFILGLYEGKPYGEDLERVVAYPDAEGWDVKLSNMYSAPGLGFAELKAIAEFFGTENIKSAGSFGYGGCETCDFGSSYGFTLEIRK